MRKNRQQGAALVVGLILLLVLTILGVAGMKTARLQLLMAGNEQFYVQAMSAAEAAIEKQIADGKFSVAYTAPSNTVIADTPATVNGTSTIQYLNQGVAPDGGYSDDVLTYRFVIDATGRAPASGDTGARIRLRQGIYVLAPGT